VDAQQHFLGSRQHATAETPKNTIGFNIFSG
jgi:hypothetical protein